MNTFLKISKIQTMGLWLGNTRGYKVCIKNISRVMWKLFNLQMDSRLQEKKDKQWRGEYLIGKEGRVSRVEIIFLRFVWTNHKIKSVPPHMFQSRTVFRI